MTIPSRLSTIFGENVLRGGMAAFIRNGGVRPAIADAAPAIIAGHASSLAAKRAASPRREPRSINPDKTPIIQPQAPTAATGAATAPAPAQTTTKRTAEPAKPKGTPTRRLTAAQLQDAQDNGRYAKLWPTQAPGPEPLTAEEDERFAKLWPTKAPEPEPLSATEQATWDKLYGQPVEVSSTPKDDALYVKLYGKGTQP